MTQFLKNLWVSIFGTTEAGGLNIGFWMSMLAVLILVVIMIVVFWTMKPKDRTDEDERDNAPPDDRDPSQYK